MQREPVKAPRTARRVVLRALVLGVFLTGVTPSALAKPPSQMERIEALLKIVGKAKVVFIRNGTRHTATEAENHMRRKLRNATRGLFGWGSPKKVTVEDFITKIASRSSMSGKPYLVEVNGAKPYPVERWLRHRLAEIEKRLGR